MIAYVFVYKRSTFKVGAHPLMRFATGVLYAEADVAIQEETEGTVDPGIYMVCSDSSDEAPTLHSSEQQNMVDYDVYVFAGKDPWPWIINPGSDSSERRAVSQSVDPSLSMRVRAAFPNLTDDDLRQAMTERNV